MEHALIAALKALADPTRLRIAGRLADGPMTETELASYLRSTRPAVRRHLERLAAVGLVERVAEVEDGRYRLRLEGFHDLGRRLAVADGSVASGPGVGPDGDPLPIDVARVLRGYFDDDRLTAIPANLAKRRVVLTYLRDRCFSDDRPYPEKEVNQRLALFHPDVAALRRYMVDGGLMTRADGVYRLPEDQPRSPLRDRPAE
jgi:hypothetical protein